GDNAMKDKDKAWSQASKRDKSGVQRPDPRIGTSVIFNLGFRKISKRYQTYILQSENKSKSNGPGIEAARGGRAGNRGKFRLEVIPKFPSLACDRNECLQLFK